MRIASTLRWALSLLLLAGAVAAGEGPVGLEGRYWLPERDGQFEVYRKGGRFFGRVIAYDVPDQRDKNNPDPALRTRRFVGIDMLESFRFDRESGQWVDGTLYDAETGNTYSGTLWFEDGEPNVLMGRGYVGFSLFGRTERFERVLP